MIEHGQALSAFLLVLLIYGFCPKFLLRFIVLAYHRDDPRRAELLAEFHYVPTFKRPLWVVQQLEAAISEGLRERFVWTLTGRLIYRWHLESGVKMNANHPDTFWIPSPEEKQQIKPGDHIRLIFEMSENWGRGRWGERMWVEVVSVGKKHLVGTLRNTPVGIPRLYPDDRIKFAHDDIIDVILDPEPDPAERQVLACHWCCHNPDWGLYDMKRGSRDRDTTFSLT